LGWGGVLGFCVFLVGGGGGGGETPKTHYLGGVNRYFQAKCAKY